MKFHSNGNLILSALLLICIGNCYCAKEWYTINDDLSVVPGKNTSSLGYGYFKDETDKDGWGKLYIKMTDSPSSFKTSSYYAAGYLEGALTWKYIYNFTVNYFMNNFNTTNLKEVDAELLSFATTNTNWMLETFTNDTSPFGVQVMNVFNQFNGLSDGYNSAISDATYQLDQMMLLLVNYIGDLEDIQGYLQYLSNQTISRDLSTSELEEIFSKTKCSALIKLPSDFSDLYTSHTTWGSYWSMLRIFKRIIIPDASAPNGYDIYYSSYPGVVASDDDYYVIKPSNLVVTETTNAVINFTIYENVKPTTLLYWIRTMVANRLSNSGPEWIENFVPYQSGTYMNQWMIVDYKLYTPFEDLKENTLWVMESVPGEYLSADVTGILQFGYWSSFNRPYFKRFQELMGYTYYESLYGDIASYQLNPRAKIFRRDQNNVYSISDMQSIMLYNQYLTDPYSQGFPGNAIASRYDLKGGPESPPNWFNATARGAVDSKIASYSLVQLQQSQAYSGPPFNNQCPPFSWSGSEYDTQFSHIGLPDLFEFDWVLMDIK